MFNTLVYIPTILAYTFISLLVVILGFIVIYVAHKIYSTLYDNLPVAQLSSKSSMSSQIDAKTLLTLGTKAESQSGRKSKTALRFIVTLESCYLAYMVFESKLLRTQFDNVPKFNPNYHDSANGCSTTSIIKDCSTFTITCNDHYLIKYFDSLSSIPTSKYLQNCDHFKIPNIYIRRM